MNRQTTENELMRIPAQIKSKTRKLAAKTIEREALDRQITGHEAWLTLGSWTEDFFRDKEGKRVAASNDDQRKLAARLRIAEDKELKEMIAKRDALRIAEINYETEIERLKAMQTNLRDLVRLETAEIAIGGSN